MTTVEWQRTLERIEVQARDLNPRQVALTLISAPFFVVGFVIAVVARVVWTAVTWGYMAAFVGWEHAGGLHGRVRSLDGPPG